MVLTYDSKSHVWRAQFAAMACDCELLIVADNELGARDAAVAAIDEVRRIEHKYSRYRADSVVAEINANAGGASLVSIDEETAQLIAFADQLFAASDGLFDITSGVLRRAWNFKNAELPSNALIAEMVALIGWHRVEHNAHQLRLPESGMEIDFGGFGKEYAADRAASVLIERGVANALVNLGGDVRALGHRGDGAPWQLGIRHPRVDGETLASIPLVNTALATSGDYERFVDVGGVRYCHVLNPKTGWPVQHWRSISVVAPVCAAAGALATIAMLKGTEALPFLREQGVSFLAVDAQGAVSTEATLP
ncbi:MAG: FAD:protein FMN transferase [Betaproteobacteria bacterium]|nr:MAG: FAD:protein FMN transferase [Betaproteobacteria bacterium]